MAKSRMDHVGDDAAYGGKIGASYGGLKALLETGALGLATKMQGYGLPKNVNLGHYLLQRGLLNAFKAGTVGAAIGGGLGALRPVKGE
mgnify:CR=1 FL=1